jgi:hypothetical protein
MTEILESIIIDPKNPILACLYLKAPLKHHINILKKNIRIKYKKGPKKRKKRKKKSEEQLKINSIFLRNKTETETNSINQYLNRNN